MSVASLANRRVTIQRATSSKDAGGGDVKTWADQFRVRLRIQPLSGADRIRHSRPEAAVTHKAYADGSPDIRAGDCFTVDGHTLYVRLVRDVDRLGRYTILECEQGDD